MTQSNTANEHRDTGRPTTPRNRPRACIFDLDGTLVDSLRDIAESTNGCLSLLGIPEIDLSAYRYLVGEGIPRLCQRAIGQTHPHLVARLTDLTRSQYRLRILRWTRPYDGIPETLAALAVRGVRLAVLSNKPDDMTKKIVRELLPEKPFLAVCGMTTEALRKPNPQTTLELCATLEARPGDVWFVGDTAIDVCTAKAAGCVSIGVTWGFRERDTLVAAGADEIIDHPRELLRLCAID